MYSRAKVSEINVQTVRNSPPTHDRVAPTWSPFSAVVRSPFAASVHFSPFDVGVIGSAEFTHAPDPFPTTPNLLTATPNPFVESAPLEGILSLLKYLMHSCYLGLKFDGPLVAIRDDTNTNFAYQSAPLSPFIIIDLPIEVASK